MYFSTFLKDDKKNINAVGDYSSYLTPFYFKNTLKQTIEIKKISVTILHNTKNNLIKYGNLNSLENGVLFYYTTSNGNKYYIIDKNNSIKNNADWFSYADVKTSILNMQEILKIVFDFSQNPIILESNCQIGFEFNDNFTSLQTQKIFLEGIMLSTDLK